jgi:cbb3-type cytochrome oxidase maturation protein
MTALAWLVPVALFLGGLGLCAFLWSLRSGQYDDLEGAGWRALDDELPVDAAQASTTPPLLADKVAGNDMMVRL